MDAGGGPHGHASEPSPPDLVVPLTALADFEAVREVLLRVPASQGHRDDGHYRLEPRPKGGQRVVIDASNTYLITASGAAALWSFARWWRRGSETAGGALELDEGGWRYCFEHPEHGRALLVEIELPTHREQDPPALREARERVGEISAEVCNRLVAAIPPEVFAGDLGEALTELLDEALLNVWEHSTPGGAGPRACIAVSIAAADQRSGSNDEWYRARAGSPMCLEVAVADAGRGVTESLGQAFAESRGQPLPVAPADYGELHDEILAFAMTPYGSRKRPDQHVSRAAAYGWRGLYRLLYSCQRADGRMMLTSGSGSYSNRPDASRQRRWTRPWPGTLLSLELALPLSVRRRSPPATRPLTTEAVQIFAEIAVRDRPPDRPWTDRTREGYARVVHDAVLAAVNREIANQILTSPHASARTNSIVVIHPALRVPPGEAYRLSTHGDGHSLAQAHATELLQMLHGHTRPDLIAVHVMLDACDDGFVRAQQQFADSEARRDADAGEPEDAQHPRLVALCRPRDGHLFWCLHVPGVRDCTRLIESGSLTAATMPPWWRTLARFHPDLVEIEQGEESTTLRLLLPTAISSDLLSQTLGNLVPRLAAEDKHEDWFWVSAGGSQASYVRTSSGQLVTQFVSVYSLCDHEPVVEQALAAAVRLQIPPGDRDQTVIVPDNEMSSYVLAKRLLGSKDDVKVVLSADLARIQAPRRIFVFADAVYHSRRLSSRLAELAAHGEQAGTLVCFDLGPEPIARTPGMRSVVRWAFPRPAAEPAPGTDAKVFSVDAMTNERIPEHARWRADPYRSLVWRGPRVGDPPAVDAVDEAVILDNANFSYGIQYIEGRFHTVRCRTENLLREPGGHRVVVSAIARLVFDEIAHDRDIVLFARDEGTLCPLLESIGHALASSTQAQAARWRGRVFGVQLITTRRESMQFIKTAVGARLDSARPLSPQSAQPQLAFGFDRASEGFFDKVREGFTAVFLDNAAVTGRAGRDFIVAMAERMDLVPAAIVVFSLVNKLNVSEERLLHQMSMVKSEAHPDRMIALRCASLVQLRVRAWRRLDSMPQILRMKELFAQTARSWNPELAAWASHLRAEYLGLATARGRVIQFLLMPGVEAGPVSIGILRLRHLLALNQSGVPVADDVARAIHQLITERDHDVLTMFALEPALLDERPIDAFADDLRGLALDALDDASRPVQTNALLVLFQTPRGLTDHAARITRAVLRHPADLLEPWLALVYALEGPERDGVIAKSAEWAGLLAAQQPTSDALRRAARMLGAEHRIARLARVPDQRSPKARLYELLRMARSGSHFGWWEVCSFMQALANGSAPAAKLAAATWDQAQDFLERDLIPALGFVEKLAGSLRAYGSGDGGAVARLASAAFDSARATHDLIGTDDFQRDELARAWSDVSRLTLWRTTDFIYARERACVLGEDNLDGQPILHRALPDLIQDVIGLLLHSLSARLPDTCTVDLTLSKEDGVREYVHGTLVEHCFQHLQRWRSAQYHELPVIWCRSAVLREMLNLVALNIRQHGDLQQVVSVSVHRDGNRLTLVAANYCRALDSHGPGMGKREIADCLAKLEGALLEFGADDVEAPPEGREFRTSMSFPVELLHLPAPGATKGTM